MERVFKNGSPTFLTTFKVNGGIYHWKTLNFYPEREYMDSHEKFKMKDLPSRSCFHNDIFKQDISDDDYEFVQTLW